MLDDICDLTLNRLKSVDLDHPKYSIGHQLNRKVPSMRGPRNPNWNGRSSEYPNHTEFKRIRLQVLIEEHFTCHYCGKPTNQVHHKDLTKYNHKRENLTACCQSCNLKQGTSKYKRLYGKTMKELSKQFICSTVKIHYLHKNGELARILAERG